jgi:arsenate reductase (thioredoxin)
VAGDEVGQSSHRNQAPPTARTRRYNVLFICPDNAIHSIMAEALLKRWGRDDFCAFSAGIEPRGIIDPRALELLKKERVWHPALRSKGYQEFLGPDAPRMNFVISLGERPADGAPSQWPGNPQAIHWHITKTDSAGKPAEVAHAFRKAFTELETRIKLLVLVYERERGKRAAA